MTGCATSRFSAEVFVSAGVPVEKVVVVPEAVDTDVFNPNMVEPVSSASPRTYGIGTQP